MKDQYLKGYCPVLSREIEKYLKSERMEGRPDSSGSFTLASSKALEKLSKHTLPRESAWVLKIVQAAVAGGAERLSFTIRGHFVEVKLKDLVEAFDLDLFSRVLTNPVLDASALMKNLAEALRVVGISQKRALVLQLFGGSRNPWLKIQNEGEILVSDSFDQGNLSAKQELYLSIEAPRQGWGARLARLFGGGGWFVDEERELRRRAYLCPIRFAVDSCEISNFLQTEVGVTTSGVEPFLWGSAPEGRLLPAFQLESRWKDWAQSASTKRDLTPARKMRLYWRHHHQPVGALWCFCFDFNNGRKMPSRVYWLQDGVIVDSHPIQEMEGLNLGLIIHLSSHGLPTDLSGWTLRTGESAVAKRYRAGLSAVLESVPLASECVGYWDFSRFSKEACRIELVALSQRFSLKTGFLPGP